VEQGERVFAALDVVSELAKSSELKRSGEFAIAQTSRGLVHALQRSKREQQRYQQNNRDRNDSDREAYAQRHALLTLL